MLVRFLKLKFIFQVLIVSSAATLAAIGMVTAATTIGDNISTTGTLNISGTAATSTFSSGGLVVGNNRFVIQQSSGNIGIGTANPVSALEVNGVITGDGSGLTSLNAANLISSTTERSGYGAYNLRRFNAKINRIQKGALYGLQADDSSSNATIAYIGDSWVAGYHIVFPLYSFINSNYAFAGAGYVPVDSYQYNVPLYGATKGSAGTWTDLNNTGLGPNLSQTTSTDTATPATKTVTCVGTDFTIYYLKKSGGGTFDYSVDYIATSTVDTANASNALGVVSITGQTLAQHTIALTVNTAGSGGVTLFGVDCTVANSRGIKIHKLGMSGSRASKFAGTTAAIWQDEIENLNPDLVIITLGGNDISAYSADDYIGYIETIIANIKAASSTIDILLAPPAAGTRTGVSGDVSALFSPLQNLARENGYGYVEPGKEFGPYETANANGMWLDGVHLTSHGDQAFANSIIKFLGLDPSSKRYPGDVVNDLTLSFFANGSGALTSQPYLITGANNTVVGLGSGSALTSGADNTLYGYAAGDAISSGYNNVFLGSTSGGSSGAGTTGYSNVAVGVNALADLTSGSQNTALGGSALASLTIGQYNTAIGYQAGTGAGAANQDSTVDTYSTFIGYESSRDTSVPQATVLTNAAAIGYQATVGCSNCLALGGTGDKAVKVGIGTASPKATLDINGFMKLKVNSSQPAACNSDNVGAFALNSGFLGCVCNGTAWNYISSSTEACVW